MKEENKIIVSENGPYLVSGDLPLTKEIIVHDNEGISTKWKKGKSFANQGNCALCRCGASKIKPFCDGTHKRIKFDGTETASNEKFSEQANETNGPELILKDAESFCSAAGFCHRAGGTWELTENSDNPNSKKTAIQEACDCPSGRLVIYDKKTGKAIEPNFKPSISLIENPGAECSGGIWVKGKIPIESYNGKKYEIRNRVTLCRCGKSQNKPFCDGTHVEVGWKD
ncbi:Iron-binding zinc finger CDGSH type [uncultured archaeon]|nr:Iron-binding zinc finger CDGSH type [uncultured archaeon]